MNSQQLLIAIAPTVFWYWRPGHRQQEELCQRLQQALDNQQTELYDLLVIEIGQLAASYNWAQGGAEQRRAWELLSSSKLLTAGN